MFWKETLTHSLICTCNGQRTSRWGGNWCSKYIVKIYCDVSGKWGRNLNQNGWSLSWPRCGTLREFLRLAGNQSTEALPNRIHAHPHTKRFRDLSCLHTKLRWPRSFIKCNKAWYAFQVIMTESFVYALQTNKSSGVSKFAGTVINLSKFVKFLKVKCFNTVLHDYRYQPIGHNEHVCCCLTAAGEIIQIYGLP